MVNKIKEKTFEIEIKKFVQKGYGLGFKENRHFFIPFTLPGERILVSPVKEKKNTVFCKIHSFLRESDKRIDPPCVYFGKCGGCHMQMANYEFQLKLKEEIVRDAFAHIGKLENLPLLPIEPSDEHFHYRVKAQLPIKRINGKIYMGFYKRESHFVADINACIIQKKSLSELIPKIKEILQQERISVYNEVKKIGRLRNVVLRCDSSEKEILIVFVCAKKGFPKILAQRIQEIYPERIAGIVENFNPEYGNRIFGYETRVIIGKGHIFEKIDNFTYRISACSFFQINPGAAGKLLRFVLSQSKDNYRKIVDAFCGVGFFTVPFSERSKIVSGIEIDAFSYRDAMMNIKINASLNIEVKNAPAENILKEYEGTELLILDPPRKGLEKPLFDAIADIKPENIWYISCNPKVCARDIKTFYQELNYDIVLIKPFDLFPQTYNIEIATLLKRK